MCEPEMNGNHLPMCGRPGRARRVSQAHLIFEDIGGFLIEGVGATINDSEVSRVLLFTDPLRYVRPHRGLNEIRAVPESAGSQVDDAQKIFR